MPRIETANRSGHSHTGLIARAANNYGRRLARHVDCHGLYIYSGLIASLQMSILTLLA